MLEEVLLRSDAKKPHMNRIDAEDIMKYTVVRSIYILLYYSMRCIFI